MMAILCTLAAALAVPTATADVEACGAVSDLGGPCPGSYGACQALPSEFAVRSDLTPTLVVDLNADPACASLELGSQCSFIGTGRSSYVGWQCPFEAMVDYGTAWVGTDGSEPLLGILPL